MHNLVTYWPTAKVRPPHIQALTGTDDDARIEHLLVTGLDHYFAGEFEAAINLWTRVLFLDRNHDRARAYIDRARSAQAEQQRISEALVHQGLEAFDKGEVVRARALLSDALNQGASHDVALGVLGRIDRLDAGMKSVAPAPASRRRVFSRTSPSTAASQRRGAIALWWATAALMVLVGGITFVLVTPNGFADWFPVQVTTSAPSAFVPPPAPLPVPSPTEAFLVQARALFAGGKLRDAQRALDRVPVGDTLRPGQIACAPTFNANLAVAGAEASSASSIANPVSPPKE